MAIATVIIAEPSEQRQQLEAALSGGDFDLCVVTPEEMDGGRDMPADPDLVLFGATLAASRLALLSRRFSHADIAPSVIVFPESGDLDQVEACVALGFDHITPPFLPSLVRSRMMSCNDRGRLTRQVEDIAATVAMRERERELSIAREIQADFLPEQMPTLDGWQIATRFRPARQVAGDFYDAFELVNGRRVGLVVADVCDKGVGAALFMALIRTLLRYTATHIDAQTRVEEDLADAVDAATRTGLIAAPVAVGAAPLVQAVIGTSRYLVTHHRRQGYFATMFFAVLDPGTGGLIYINGGHNPPILTRADGTQSILEATGPAVGMLPDSIYSLGYIVLRPGDRLLIYTDGVVEARDTDGAFLGLAPVRALLAAAGRSTAAELVDNLDDAILRHVGAAAQYDDITMLLLERDRTTPAAPGGSPR